jgi:hypothetical protein
MFDQLETTFERPKPFEVYTADELWTDDHTSAQMLAFHLDEEVDLASRGPRDSRHDVGDGLRSEAEVPSPVKKDE